MTRLTILAALLVAACGGGSDGATVDAPPSADSAPVLPTTCTGACAVTNAVAMFGAGILPFERAYYGLTDGPATDTLHVEAYSGGEEGCQPAAADATLVIDVVQIPTDLVPYTTGAGLVDLTGFLLTDQPTASTSDARITPSAWVDGEAIAIDVSATFTNGTVIGHIHAVHCPAMDAAE